MERVQKLLAQAGIASRRKCEELIKQGRVTVNGKVISIGQSAEPRDIIAVDGKKIQLEKKVTLMLHKPIGYITTVKETRGRKTVMDLVKVNERVYPIGRLDKNTEGLLLLTNDGELANLLMHPRYGVEKEYAVTLASPFAELKKLKRGVIIDGRRVAVTVIDMKGNTITIRIHEGRKHIVRKIFKKLKKKVVRLMRTKVATLELGTLKAGKWRKLTAQELTALRRNA